MAASTNVATSSSGNEQLLPVLVDSIAKAEPQAVWSEYPASATRYDAGFKTVTYAQLANAVNGAAWWLETTLGKGIDFETVAYIGPNDLRYPIFVLGAVKAGYKLLLTSPRNSYAAHANLFDLLQCTTLITPNPLPAPVLSILARRAMRVAVVPGLDSLLDEPHPHYAYDKSFAQARHEPLAVLHTSGSTGLPKPIVLPHAFATTFANMTQFRPPKGFLSQPRILHGSRLFCTLPPFHAIGLYFGLFSPVFNRTVFICPLSGTVPSGEGLVEALEHTQAECAFLAPSVVEDISKDSRLLDQVATKLSAICYSGGDLPQPIGDLVASKMRLFTIYGTTEMAHGPQIAQEGGWSHQDWKYLQWNEGFWGADFRHHAGDLYELFIVQTPESRKYQTAFTLFPEKQELSTRDLFSPHPYKAGLWAYRGRSDDIIVFLNGEKTNPLSMEGQVSSHPEVRSALVIGAQRFQAALLIELVRSRALSAKERAELVDDLWPCIDEANKECPAHARVARSHVLFVKSRKPMCRAGKGTVMRQATLDLYSREIDELYADADGTSAPTRQYDAQLESVARDPAALQDYLRESVSAITGWKDLSRFDDFFALGMDSLHAMQLAQRMRALHPISLTTIYKNPSVSALAQVLLRKRSAPEGSDSTSREQTLSTMLKSYQDDIDEYARRTNPAPPLPAARSRSSISLLRSAFQVVILTGSTGALGSYVLHCLLNNSFISHVYCLNRAPDSRSLQIERNRARNLPTVFPPDRVTFLTADLSESGTFGLDSATYDALRLTVTTIMHTAWSVDFNLNLASFGSQLAGVGNLARFAAGAIHSPSMLFVSSISAVQGYASQQTVPERVIADPSAPAPTGYGESKHLAERLLDHAAKTLRIKVGIARLGQISGPVSLPGAWNKKEWLPSLVISSMRLGAVPDSLGESGGPRSHTGEIDWVPMDLLAHILIDLALDVDQLQPFGRPRARARGARVFHPVNPGRTTWSALLPTVIKALESAGQQRSERGATAVKKVAFGTWLEMLRESAASIKDEADMAEVLAANPAIKLVDFYERMGSGAKMPVLDTEQTAQVSPALRTLEPIDSASMARWIRRWLA